MTDAAAFEYILYEKRDNRAVWSIINRAKLYNAIWAQTIKALMKAFEIAGYDMSLSIIVPDGATRQTGLGKVPGAALRALRGRRGLKIQFGLIAEAVCEGALVRPDLFRPAGRERRPRRRRHAHEAHGRPPVRRQLPLIGARRRTQTDAVCRHGGCDGRQCARRAGRQPAGRRRQARANQRGAGDEGAHDY